MAKPNPFAGNKAPPFGKGGAAPARGKAPPFEKSKRDVEPRGMREGSPADMALDRKQRAAPPPMATPMNGPPMGGFKKGGKVRGR